MAVDLKTFNPLSALKGLGGGLAQAPSSGAQGRSPAARTSSPW